MFRMSKNYQLVGDHNVNDALPEILGKPSWIHSRVGKAGRLEIFFCDNLVCRLLGGFDDGPH